MKVRLLAAARAELKDAVVWYDNQAPGTGTQFLKTVLEAMRTIEQRPQTWPRIVKSTQKYVLRRFPYNIVFEIDGDDLIIIAVAHHRRRSSSSATRLLECSAPLIAHSMIIPGYSLRLGDALIFDRGFQHHAV